MNVASSGVGVGAARVTVRASRVRNVRFGISVSGKEARIQGNLVDGFSADGMRGLGDFGRFEYNRVQNNYVRDPPDTNHDDGFQPRTELVFSLPERGTRRRRHGDAGTRSA